MEQDLFVHLNSIDDLSVDFKHFGHVINYQIEVD